MMKIQPEIRSKRLNELSTLSDASTGISSWMFVIGQSGQAYAGYLDHLFMNNETKQETTRHPKDELADCVCVSRLSTWGYQYEHPFPSHELVFPPEDLWGQCRWGSQLVNSPACGVERNVVFSLRGSPFLAQNREYSKGESSLGSSLPFLGFLNSTFSTLMWRLLPPRAAGRRVSRAPRAG
jgi:hypothetical protein